MSTGKAPAPAPFATAPALAVVHPVMAGATRTVGRVAPVSTPAARAGLHAPAAVDTTARVAAPGQLGPVMVGRPKQGH